MEPSPSATVPPPTTFPKFSSLPLETQFSIFNFSKAPTRHIEIFYSPLDQRYKTDTPAPALLHTCHASRKELLKRYDIFHMDVPCEKNGVTDWLYNVEEMDFDRARGVEGVSLGEGGGDGSDNSDDGERVVVRQPTKRTIPFTTYIDWEIDTISLSPNHFQDRGYTRVPYHFKDFIGGMMYSPGIIENLQVLSMEAKTFEPRVMAVPISRMKGLKKLLLVVLDRCCGRIEIEDRNTVRIVEKRHRRMRSLREVEEEEENLELWEKTKISELGWDLICDKGSERWAFFMVESTAKKLMLAIQKEVALEGQREEGKKKGVRSNWEEVEIEAVTVHREHGSH